MSRRTAFAITLPVLLLAACGKGGDGKGTDISIKDENGNVVAAADGDGKVSLDVPGFSASVSMPKLEMPAESLDMDGVKLYPGSKISGMNIRDGGDKAKDHVDIHFTAPAAPEKVRDYFLNAFNGKGAALAATPSGLSGKTKNGDDLSIDLKAVGKGAEGKIVILSNKE